MYHIFLLIRKMIINYNDLTKKMEIYIRIFTHWSAYIGDVSAIIGDVSVNIGDKSYKNMPINWLSFADQSAIIANCKKYE